MVESARALSRVVARRCERVIYNIPCQCPRCGAVSQAVHGCAAHFSPQNLFTLHAYYHLRRMVSLELPGSWPLLKRHAEWS